MEGNRVQMTENIIIKPELSAMLLCELCPKAAEEISIYCNELGDANLIIDYKKMSVLSSGKTKLSLPNKKSKLFKSDINRIRVSNGYPPFTSICKYPPSKALKNCFGRGALSEVTFMTQKERSEHCPPPNEEKEKIEKEKEVVREEYITVRELNFLKKNEEFFKKLEEKIQNPGLKVVKVLVEKYVKIEPKKVERRLVKEEIKFIQTGKIPKSVRIESEKTYDLIQELELIKERAESIKIVDEKIEKNAWVYPKKTKSFFKKSDLIKEQIDIELKNSFSALEKIKFDKEHTETVKKHFVEFKFSTVPHYNSKMTDRSIKDIYLKDYRNKNKNVEKILEICGIGIFKENLGKSWVYKLNSEETVINQDWLNKSLNIIDKSDRRMKELCRVKDLNKIMSDKKIRSEYVKNKKEVEKKKKTEGIGATLENQKKRVTMRERDEVLNEILKRRIKNNNCHINKRRITGRSHFSMDDSDEEYLNKALEKWEVIVKEFKDKMAGFQSNF